MSGSDDSSFYHPLKNSDITKDLFTEAGRSEGDAVSSLRQKAETGFSYCFSFVCTTLRPVGFLVQEEASCCRTSNI